MRWETRCAPRGATRIGIECIVYIHILRRLVMARAITTPIRQIASKGRQPKGARQAQSKGLREIDKSVESVVDATLKELSKINEAGRAPRYDSKKNFENKFPLWIARLVDSKKHPDPKRRVRFAKKVFHELKKRKMIVTVPDTDKSIKVYATSFMEQRRLAMAAHPSTGNVATIREGVAA